MWFLWTMTTRVMRTVCGVRCPECGQQIRPGEQDPHVICCPLRECDYSATRRARQTSRGDW